MTLSKSSVRKNFQVQEGREPASWSSGNAFVSRAEGHRFKSRAGQIGQSVANGSLLLRHFFLQHFFERNCVAWSARTLRWATLSRYTLWRITASTKFDLICDRVFSTFFLNGCLLTSFANSTMGLFVVISDLLFDSIYIGSVY